MAQKHCLVVASGEINDYENFFYLIIDSYGGEHYVVQSNNSYKEVNKRQFFKH